MTESIAPDASPPDETPAFDEATAATLEALDAVLDELREHDDAVPQWEFCDGFLTALLCTRDEVETAEWLPVLLGAEATGPDDDAPFSSAGQRTRFLMHWMARAAQLRTALEAQVEALDDPRALVPAMMDWRGMLNALPPEERGNADADEEAPAYGQMWAIGFLTVVDVWSEDWAAPRDKEIAADIDDALDCIAALAEDDRARPEHNLFDEAAPPSVSEQRLTEVGEALFAVYDLHAIARALGPRVRPAHNPLKIGRNDPCPCGSGRKYKKCCGA